MSSKDAGMSVETKIFDQEKDYNPTNLFW